VSDFWKLMDERNINLPGNVRALLEGCASFRFFGSTEGLTEAATMGQHVSAAIAAATRMSFACPLTMDRLPRCRM